MQREIEQSEILRKIAAESEDSSSGLLLPATVVEALNTYLSRRAVTVAPVKIVSESVGDEDRKKLLQLSELINRGEDVPEELSRDIESIALALRLTQAELKEQKEEQGEKSELSSEILARQQLVAPSSGLSSHTLFTPRRESTRFAEERDDGCYGGKKKWMCITS